MQIAGHKFTNLEKVGIVVAIIVMVTFTYQKHVYSPLEKKIQRLNVNHKKLSDSVSMLRSQQAGGKIKRDISQLRRRLGQERKLLKQAEACLANDSEVSKISNQILTIASKCGVAVKLYSPVTDKEFIKLVGKDKIDTYYNRPHYKMILSGSFRRLKSFLWEITQLPRLVIIENISFEKTKKGTLTATLGISI
jgi:Tfp pilus assembly protein PilO